MTQTKRKQRLVGRRRWAELTRFLTQAMKSSGSERVRMAAAVHLKEVLVIREQRELVELRAAARQTETQNNPAIPEQAEPVQEPAGTPESAQERARRFLESLSATKETQTNG